MLIVGAIGIKFGKWQRLLYGTDYQGQSLGRLAAVVRAA